MFHIRDNYIVRKALNKISYDNFRAYVFGEEGSRPAPENGTIFCEYVKTVLTKKELVFFTDSLDAASVIYDLEKRLLPFDLYQRIRECELTEHTSNTLHN